MENTYKTAFEGLVEIIEGDAEVRGNYDLARTAHELQKEMFKYEKQAIEQGQEQGNAFVTKEEFESMGYKEKLVLKKEQPEAYSMAQNGQFKEMI